MAFSLNAPRRASERPISTSRPERPTPDHALRHVIEASKALLTVLDTDRLLALIVDRAVGLAQAERGLLLLGSSVERLELRAAQGFGAEALSASDLKISRSVAEEVLETGKPILSVCAPDADNLKDRDSVRLLRLQTVMCAPLTVAERTLGVLYVDSSRARAGFDQAGLAAFELLADLAAIALENARLYRLANTDPRTGLANVGRFHARLAAELAEARAGRARLALLLIDLDHFKRVNDQHGHPAGDLVLVELAAILTGVVRAQDLAARIGGEEFALLIRLPGPEEADEAGPDVPALIGERVRAAVEAHAFTLKGGVVLRVTASLGLARWPTPGVEDADGLVSLADRCLYQAKAQGRNRVVEAPAD